MAPVPHLGVKNGGAAIGFYGKAYWPGEPNVHVQDLAEIVFDSAFAKAATSATIGEATHPSHHSSLSAGRLLRN